MCVVDSVDSCDTGYVVCIRTRPQIDAPAMKILVSLQVVVVMLSNTLMKLHSQ